MSDLRLAISLDCDDPVPLSVFWAQLLGGDIIVSAATHAVVKVDRKLLLVAMHVENYAPPDWPRDSVPKQAHIDVEVDDLQQAENLALTLGAVRAERQSVPGVFLVFYDPAGHPFCLTTAFPD
jgi:Glyoxalase-like domain